MIGFSSIYTYNCYLYRVFMKNRIRNRIVNLPKFIGFINIIAKFYEFIDMNTHFCSKYFIAAEVVIVFY